MLAATDPANPYGAALPWPERPSPTASTARAPAAAAGHRAGRKAGALVVLVDGELVLYVERGGRTLLSWTEDETVLKEAATALSSAVAAGALGRMTVQKADGASVHESGPLSAALQAAGFAATPRGLRLRGLTLSGVGRPASHGPSQRLTRGISTRQRADHEHGRDQEPGRPGPAPDERHGHQLERRRAEPGRRPR